MTAKSVLSLGLFCCISNFIIGQTFENVTSSLGINEYLPPTTMGSGVSIHDVDSNGWEDIVLSIADEGIICYYNFEGTFDRQIIFAGLGEFKTSIFGDYDNDSDDDLFITRDYGNVVLLRNDGDLVFTDVTADAGFILTNNARSWGASWSDLDLDGDLDLFVCNYNRAGFDPFEMNDWFYLNNGDGTFTESSLNWGFTEVSDATFQSTVFPINNDIYPDLVAINDYQPKNKVYLSQASGEYLNSFSNMQEAPILNAMSAAVADFDRDGDFDMYCTNTSINGNHLFVNENQILINKANIFGLKVSKFCAGAIWIDIDNDLYSDLFVSTAEDWDTFETPAFIEDNLLFKNENGAFTALEMPEEIVHFNTYVVAKGDLNNDGFYDLVLSTSLESGIQVLYNNENSSSNNWIKVKLEGTVSNSNGYGSLIEYFINGSRYIDFTNGGSDYISQNSENVIYPVGLSSVVDSFFVHWPSQITDKFYNLNCNVNYTFVEGMSFVQLTSTSDSNVLCDGEEVVLSINPTDATVEWNNGATGFSISVTESGSYWATIQTQGGVLLFTDTISFQQSENVDINLTTENPSCYGLTDGFVDLGIIEGADVYSVDWNDGFQGTFRNNMSSGEYLFTITDLNGCTFNYNLNLEDPEFFGSFSGSVDAQCYETPTGEIFFESAFGGTYPYEVLLNNVTVASQLNLTELNDFNISGLEAGSYILTCIDAQGCISEANHMILQSEQLIASNSLIDNFVQITVVGGTPPYEFQWSNSELNGSSVELETGEYFVNVVDAEGCSFFLEIIVPVGVASPIETQFDYSYMNGEVLFKNDMRIIEIVDSRGRTVQTAQQSSRIYLSGLETGMYLLCATDYFNKKRFEKITIQN
jgi:hypothetical protein